MYMPSSLHLPKGDRWVQATKQQIAENPDLLSFASNVDNHTFFNITKQELEKLELTYGGLTTKQVIELRAKQIEEQKNEGTL